MLIEHGYYLDGTKYFIYRDNGVCYVTESDGIHDENVFEGTFEQCIAFISERYAEISSSLVG